MKKLFSPLLLAAVSALLTLSPVGANEPLTVALTLKKPAAPSSYGVWKMKYAAPDQIESIYRGAIIEQKSRTAPFTIRGLGIDIFDKDIYSSRFLKQGFYWLEWVVTKGTIAEEMWKVTPRTKEFIRNSVFFKSYTAQKGWKHFDWDMALADYLNSTIPKIPPMVLTIKNSGAANVTVANVYTKTIFTEGGEASPGGIAIDPATKRNLLVLRWDKSSKLLLAKPLHIIPGGEARLPLSLFVDKGAEGDGSGRMTYALFVEYDLGGKKQVQLLALIRQSEDHGFQTGW